MIARMRIGMGAITGIALIMLALWVWARAGELAVVLAGGASRPELERWAVCCVSIAAGAGAQLVLQSTVVSAVYSRRFFDEAVRAAAGMLACAAILSAMTLALMGR